MIITQSATAQGSPDAAARNRALIAQSFEAWANGTGSPYDLLAEDASWTITGNSAAAKTYPTKEAFMAEVIRPFNARRQTRLVPTVPKLYAEGETVIAFFDAKGTARDGKPYANTYAWILDMKVERSSGPTPSSTASPSTISGSAFSRKRLNRKTDARLFGDWPMSAFDPRRTFAWSLASP